MNDVEELLTEEEAAERRFQEWRAQYLWYVDQLPNVVQAVGTVAMAPQMLRAAQLRERVSGGGLIDNMPVVDGPESRYAAAVWHALRAYLTIASSRLGVEAPALPNSLPDDVDTARRWAFIANEWMAAGVDHLLELPDLAAAEGELFRLIRRAHPARDGNRSTRSPGDLRGLRRGRRDRGLGGRPRRSGAREFVPELPPPSRRRVSDGPIAVERRGQFVPPPRRRMPPACAPRGTWQARANAAATRRSRR